MRGPGAPAKFREHGVVPTLGVGGARLAGAVGRVAVHLQTPAPPGYAIVAGGHRGDNGADRRALFLFCSHRCGRIRLRRTGIGDAKILVGGRGRLGAVTDCAGVGPVVAVAADHLLAHRRVAALLTARLGQLAVGDQPGARLGRDVPAKITRSGATLRAIRHRPSVPSESSAGSTS